MKPLKRNEIDFCGPRQIYIDQFVPSSLLCRPAIQLYEFSGDPHTVRWKSWFTGSLSVTIVRASCSRRARCQFI